MAHQAPFTGAQVDDAVSRSLGRYEAADIDALRAITSKSWNKSVIVWSDSNGGVSTFKWKSGGSDADAPDLYIRPNDFGEVSEVNAGVWEQKS